MVKIMMMVSNDLSVGNIGKNKKTESEAWSLVRTLLLQINIFHHHLF